MSGFPQKGSPTIGMMPTPIAQKCEKLIYNARRKPNPEPIQSMWPLLKEFLKFARQEKKWWLIPLIVLLLLLGVVLIFTASSGIAWALYPFL